MEPSPYTIPFITPPHTYPESTASKNNLIRTAKRNSIQCIPNPTSCRATSSLDSKQNINKENQENESELFQHGIIKRANSAPSLGEKVNNAHSLGSPKSQRSITKFKTTTIDLSDLKKCAATPTYTLDDLPNNFLNMSFIEVIELCECELVRAYNKVTASSNNTLFIWSNTMNISDGKYIFILYSILNYSTSQLIQEETFSDLIKKSSLASKWLLGESTQIVQLEYIGNSTNIPHKLSLNINQTKYTISLSMRGVDLQKVNLNGAKLATRNFEGAQLNNASMIKADLSISNFIAANFDDADLTDAICYAAIMKGASFINSTLIGINMSAATVIEANFNGSNMNNAMLVNTNLRFAKLQGTILNGACLRGANFSYSDLSGADLDNTDFVGANFTKTIFGSDQVINLDKFLASLTIGGEDKFYKAQVLFILGAKKFKKHHQSYSINYLLNKGKLQIILDGLITSISTIDDKYANMKENLLEQINRWHDSWKSL